MQRKIDYVTEYAQKVVNGDLLASKKNIKTCKRHLRDMQNTNFEYYFDENKANEIINFLEMLPDPKTGKPMELAGFQKFIVGSLMGWLDYNGNKRFTKAYLSMSRKNGKVLPR